MFPFLQIKRYKDFDKNILPKIDAIAEKQGKTRSDLVRDILYARFGYKPKLRSQDQINEDYAVERQEETKVEYRCIVVRVDNEYRDLFFKYILTQPGRLDRNYRKYLNQTLYHYFDIEVQDSSTKKVSKKT